MNISQANSYMNAITGVPGQVYTSPLGLGGGGLSGMSGMSGMGGLSGMSGMSGMGGLAGMGGMSGMGGLAGMGGSGGIIGMLLQMMQMICSMLMMLLGSGLSGMMGGSGSSGGDPYGGSGSGGIPSPAPSSGYGGGRTPSPAPSSGYGGGGGTPSPAPSSGYGGGGGTPSPAPSSGSGGGGGTPSPAPSSGSGGGEGTPSPAPSSGSGGGEGIPSPAPSSGGGTASPGDETGQIQWDKMPANLKKLQPYIQQASKATGTPETIIAGCVWQESGGNVSVTATDGGSDQGLMQIDNTTYDKEIAGQHGLEHGKTPTGPAQNILAGATYLAMMKNKFGTWDLALRGYNSGENGVDIHDPNARPAGTGDPTYIISVRDHIKHFVDGTPPQNRG